MTGLELTADNLCNGSMFDYTFANLNRPFKQQQPNNVRAHAQGASALLLLQLMCTLEQQYPRVKLTLERSSDVHACTDAQREEMQRILYTAHAFL